MSVSAVFPNMFAILALLVLADFIPPAAERIIRLVSAVPGRYLAIPVVILLCGLCLGREFYLIPGTELLGLLLAVS